MWGAFIGGIAGVFVLPPWGLLLLPLVGAFLGERLAGRNLDEALKGTKGAVLGLLGGILGKFLIHLLMGLLVIRAIF
ncbi:MAG: DUF456 family protein [Meiothermus sp.]|uniref:DUF456 family protein n=1 Tax=Meiothermus sp. TaxID=1955249 RepID=UPI00298F2A12|nr:DUF456 family protein [Meiothermus sp.]MDW8482251.1 DUF456 family protein [Meiothermus sp.]